MTNIESGEEIRLLAQIELLRETPAIQVGFTITNVDGVGVFQFGTNSDEDSGQLSAGQRVTVDARVENLLTPGRYFVHFGVKRYPDKRAVVLHVEKALDFHVFGAAPTHGVVELPYTIKTLVENPGPR